MDRRTFMKGAAIAVSTPAAIGAVATLEIDLLVRRFYADKDAWSSTADEDGDLIADGPVYERSWSSCKDLVRYQCKTDEDVRRKVSAILDNGWLEETAEIGFGDEPFHFRDFLKTLVVPAQS